ncbi:MAG: class I SAM-dependent methyltransferase [Spirochaetes bacterium]|nr:class I SAM-dependent methyltransferase [Spirochaetota bacterium]
MKLYHELAEFYFEIENKSRNIQADVSFIKSYLPSGGNGSVLDIGCGSGEHINEFAKMGYACTGLDNSSDMIMTAVSRCISGIEFIEADMKDFDYYEKYDLIYSIFGSMNYLLTNEEIDSVFWNSWRALKNGGIGIFEVWNAFPLLEIREKDVARVSTTIQNGTKIIRERGFKLKTISPTIVNVKYNYHITDRDGNTDLLEDTHIMRAFKKEEITKIINDNGFSIKEIFSSNLKDPYHGNSNKLLIVVKKN